MDKLNRFSAASIRKLVAQACPELLDPVAANDRYTITVVVDGEYAVIAPYAPSPPEAKPRRPRRRPRTPKPEAQAAPPPKPDRPKPQQRRSTSTSTSR